jgi:hypothetical protein
MTLKTFVMGGLIIAAAAFTSGCAKLTFERWQTLNTQSSKMEVETVLGEPNGYKKADRWMYHNPDEQITCTVEFAGGGDNLTYSQWVDPKHGRHETGKAEIEGSNLIQRETGKTDIDKP